MSVKMIALAVLNSEQKEAAQSYSAKAKDLILKFGGRPEGRYGLIESLVGQTPAQVTLVVDFDDASQIKDFINSDEYQALVPERELGFQSMNIYIAQ